MLVSVFKVFSIDEDEFVETVNLRVGKNLNLNFSCNDVAWSSHEGKSNSIHCILKQVVYLC